MFGRPVFATETLRYEIPMLSDLFEEEVRQGYSGEPRPPFPQCQILRDQQTKISELVTELDETRQKCVSIATYSKELTDQIESKEKNPANITNVTDL